MSGVEVREARKARGWTQTGLAHKLGVSQGYVSLLESKQRPVPWRLAAKAVSVLGLSPNKLPVRSKPDPLSATRVAGALGTLGYPGFAHLHYNRKLNPAEVVVRALRSRNVEARVVEALPWVLAEYPEFDWQSLMPEVKQNDLQNRLGFVVTVARQLAERRGRVKTAATLSTLEHTLEGSRLQREDSFAGDALTEAERRWLRTNRSAEAVHWNLLTSVNAENLDGV